MEEKKTIKISMSTFFLIIAIITICVMGFFIYKLNNEKMTVLQQTTTLNNQSAKSENKQTIIENNTNTQDSTEKYTYENISGYFTFDEKIPVDYGTYTSDTEARKFLYLYENGMYFYDGGLGTANHLECGNYIIKNDEIILHSWFEETTYGNNKGLYLNKDISLLNGYKFTINSVNSISPELGFTNYPNVDMKRETNSESVKAAANKYEERLKHDTLYNYNNTDMYTQPGQGQAES